MPLVTTEQMLEIIRAFRQNEAPLGYRMMGPEQNDEVNRILNTLEKQLGSDYLKTDDVKLEGVIKATISN